MSENYFQKLNQVNVSAHVEKKGQFTYLSWPFAVQELGKIDPQATWEVVRFDGLPYLKSEAGHFVEVAVTCMGVRKSQIHPVLDGRNKPIASPTAFDINTSIQRALVKAIALHGLGLYIYAGEDLPEGDKPAVDPMGQDGGERMSTGTKKDGTTKPAKNQFGASRYLYTEGLGPAEIDEVVEVAGKVKRWLVTKDLRDAVLEKENANLEATQTVFFWTFFDSKERHAMKEEHDKLKDEYKQKEPA